MKTIYLQKNNYCLLWLILFSSLFNYNSKAQTNLTDSCAFFGDRPIFPYYHPTPPINGKDFYTLKKQFANSLTAQTNFDGIITIIFFINYKGESDFYRTQLVDLNYQTISITEGNNQLCEQALLAVENCGPWMPAKDASNKGINSRKFYSFKFVKGKLIEILPK